MSRNSNSRHPSALRVPLRSENQVRPRSLASSETTFLENFPLKFPLLSALKTCHQFGDDLNISSLSNSELLGQVLCDGVDNRDRKGSKSELHTLSKQYTRAAMILARNTCHQSYVCLCICINTCILCTPTSSLILGLYYDRGDSTFH